MTTRVDINRLLVEMRSMKSQTQAFNRPDNVKDVADSIIPNKLRVNESKEVVPSFSDMMSQAVGKVNETQKASASLQKAYEMGDPNVDITDVMIASQKSSVAFQATLQVRNKVIEAYRDIMNMPV